MDEIRIKIQQTLPSIDNSLIKSIIEHLIELGVTDTSHLNLIEEKDLLPVVKVIQARLLIKSWRNEVDNTSSASDVSHEVAEKQKQSMNAVNISKTAANNLEWAHEFTIPWENLDQELIKSLEEDKRPSPSLRRKMIRTVTDAIQKITEKPGKMALGIIARKMVNKYPSALADSLCGEIVGEGYSSIHKQMEVRFDNLNRTSPLNLMRRKVKHQEKTPGVNKRKLGVSDCYGTVNWQPLSLPIHETEETQKMKKITMLEMALTNPKSFDRDIVKKLLHETYYTVRIQINNNNSIASLKEEWPLLFSQEGIYDHFESLVGFDIFKKFSDSVASKGFRLMSYLKSVSKVERYKEKFQQWIGSLENDECSEDPNLCLLLSLLMVYFKENIEDLFIAVDVNMPSDDVLKLELPVTPCLICYGENVSNASGFMLVIDKQVAVSYIQDFTNAVALMFSSYFCFNIHYPQSACATLEFIQRCFLGITPNKGSKANPEKKKKEQINTKVLSLINKLSNFEWNC